MFKSFLSITLRNFARQKVFAGINIFGLSVGLASAILIFLYIFDELSYDRIHQDPENTYLIGTKRSFEDGNSFEAPSAPAVWSEELAAQLPEVESFTRYIWTGYPTTISYRPDDRIVLTEELIWVDPTYPDVLYYESAGGEKSRAFSLPNSIVMSESAAGELFGDEDPLNKSISVRHPFLGNRDIELLVTGVFRDYPSNSHLKPKYLVNNQALQSVFNERYDQIFHNWQGSFMTSYIKLKEGAAIESVSNSLDNMLESNLQENATFFEPIFRKLTDVHFDAEMRWGNEDGRDKAYIYIFSSIAILILFIACINYMNLATARSARRSREVGLRKTMGTNRNMLIFQFLTESFLTTLVSVILAVILVVLILPYFNLLSQKSFVLTDLGNPAILAIIAGVTVFVAFIAGSYPAFFLSRYKPADAFRSSSGQGRGGSDRFRRVLVIMQYAISLLLIICTILIFRQVNLLKDSKLNEQGDQIVSIRYGGSAPYEKYPVLREQILQDPQIREVTMANHLPRQNYFGGIGANFKIPEVSDQDYQWSQLNVDYEFPEMFSLDLVAGRNFQEDNPADSNAYLLNETAVKNLGKTNEEVLGLTITDQSTERQGKIIGVVKDFPYRSMQQTIGPLAINARPHPIDQIVYAKLPAGQISDKLKVLESKWKGVFPETGFDYWFVNDEFARMYAYESRLADLTRSFSILAIFIACLGLFGLASYMAEQKTREVGIRKVMGASFLDIFWIFISVFLLMLGVAVVISVPVGYLLMKEWLQGFAYQVSIDWTLFVIVILGVLLLTLVTVGYELYKASSANPVEALRYE